MVLDEARRDFLKEGRGRAVDDTAHLPPSAAARDEELVARPRDRDVEKPPLLLDVPVALLEAPRVRDDPVLRADDEDDGEFEPLRRVYRHQVNLALVLVLLQVVAADQGDSV